MSANAVIIGFAIRTLLGAAAAIVNLPVQEARVAPLPLTA
jgi:hypothetical protein